MKMLCPGLRASPAPDPPPLARPRSHVEVLELVHMEAAAAHAGLRGPTGGAIRPGRMLGLAHGVTVEMTRAPEGSTGRWQLRTMV